MKPQKDEPMTDKPNTLSLDATEWRVLLASSIARVNEFLNANATVKADDAKNLLDHLDRTKSLVTAWRHVSAQSEAPVADVSGANGAEPVKKRGGWPAGKSRKARQAQAVQ